MFFSWVKQVIINAEEEKIRFHNTLEDLAKASATRPPSIDVKFDDVSEPACTREKIVIPYAFCAKKQETDVIFELGKLAGLVLLYQNNEDFRKFFHNQKTRPVLYTFWLYHVLDYTGFFAMHRRASPKDARKKASRARAHAKEKRQLPVRKRLDWVGTDYAAQLYLKLEDGVVGYVLANEDINSLHDVVVPDEDFLHFTQRITKK